MQITRTTSEIIARITAVEPYDFFGKRFEVLVTSLPFEDAKPYLKDPDADPSIWEHDGPDAVFEKAKDYLAFAVEKIKDERGLSASRSVDAFREYVWLLTDDATADELEATDYGWYGDQQIRFAAEALGLAEEFNTMMEDGR